MTVDEEDPPADLDLDELRRVLADAPVTLALLYGSRARGEAGSGSDIDLAVAFRDSLSSPERTRTRLSLIERLDAALGTDAVDVIPLDRAPDALLGEILRDGIVVHGEESALERYRSRDGNDGDDRERLDDVLADIEAFI
jgi:predicted nucleotidyltransferase